jgi:hypothetical protein
MLIIPLNRLGLLPNQHSIANPSTALDKKWQMQKKEKKRNENGTKEKKENSLK